MSDSVSTRVSRASGPRAAGASRCALGVMLASTVFATLSVGTHLGVQGLRVQRGHFGLAESVATAPAAAPAIYVPAMAGVSH